LSFGSEDEDEYGILVEGKDNEEQVFRENPGIRTGQCSTLKFTAAINIRTKR
jgi:hypothetical protein